MGEPLSGRVINPGEGGNLRTRPDTGNRLPAAGRPLVASVGDIAGLRPRRARGDGGEVTGAWVDVVDQLERPEWNWVAGWLRDLKSAGTRRTYLGDVAAFVIFLDVVLPGADLRQANEDVAVHYRETLAVEGLAASTTARRLATMSSLYRYALRPERRVDGIDRNPFANITRPVVAAEGKTPALDLEQTAALVDACEQLAERHPADGACAALLVHTAIRVSEAIGLRVGSIVWTSGHCTITIRRKGGKEAVVPLPPLVCSLLEPLTLDRAPDEPLFVQDGRSWDRWRPYTALRRVAKLAGIDVPLHPHMLRATAATLLWDAGVDPAVIQELLGHANLATSQLYNRGHVKLERSGTYRVAGIIADARK